MSQLARDAKIYLAGHRGLVGSALLLHLEGAGFENIVTRASGALDLRDQNATQDFFRDEKPEIVILAAARVGGILANSTYPAQFIYDNLMIAANVIEAAHRVGTRKLLNLGSSCIYPKMAPQPLREDALLSGPLEATNRPYALAKIAAIELCDSYRAQYGDDFISAMPTNLYGPGDNFSLHNAHVLPAMMRKMHEAKLAGAQTVEIWGSGTPRREFLHSQDLARASLFLLENFSQPGPINVGVGEDISIRGLALLLRDVVGFKGELSFDASKPDGTPRKLMDVSRLNGLGWHAQIALREGVARTYDWFRENVGALAER